MDGSKRKLGPYKKDLLTDDANEKCLPSVTNYEGNLKFDSSEECLDIKNVDFPSTSNVTEMKPNKKHLVCFFFSCFHLLDLISGYLVFIFISNFLKNLFASDSFSLRASCAYYNNPD